MRLHPHHLPLHHLHPRRRHYLHHHRHLRHLPHPRLRHYYLHLSLHLMKLPYQIDMSLDRYIRREHLLCHSIPVGSFLILDFPA